MLAPRIGALLESLRARIRGYIWVDGAARVGIVLGAAFWITLAFDWLFEPPWQFRAVVLAGVATGLAYVAYRSILSRVFYPLDDASMALVLERRFRDYHDSLLTTVELGRRPAHAATFNQEMLSYTRGQALAKSEAVRLADVFRIGPLLRTIAAASALLISVVAFSAVAQGAFHTWFQRVVLLNHDLLWPRNNHVRVQGFPADRRVKVAKGSDYEMVAAADLQPPFRLPHDVQVRYRTDEGTHGQDNMSSVGAAGPRDPLQKYSYTFKGIMSSIDFDVFGGDDRDRGYRLEVVDSPAISKMELACEYPAYTGRPAGIVPATGLVQLPAGTKITIQCQANKDLVEVPVSMVQGDKPPTQLEVQLSPADPRHFTLQLPELMEDTTLLFDLHDADGIHSRDPVRLTLTALPDEAPIVALRLRGISTAITAQARLPAVGEVRDDYGLARIWFEYQLNSKPAANSAAAGAGSSASPANDAAKNPAPAGAAEQAADAAQQIFHTSTLERDGRPKAQLTIEAADNEALDIQQVDDLGELLRRRGVKTRDDLKKITAPNEVALLTGIKDQADIDRALTFEPAPGGKLYVTFKAADNCALPAGQNIGQGEKYELDIVPPEQLVSMLEGRELMLRRRFETIYQEMTDTRDALARVDFTPPDAKPADDKPGREPGDEPEDKSADAATANETPEQRTARLAKRAAEIRDLRVNRALDNSDRSASETLTVADSFDDIREEMVNNRVDTPEVQVRLKDQIADPLRRISVKMFPQLKARLQQLRRVLDDPSAGKARLQESVAQADAILVQMKLVLDKMLELETFNEVVDQLRQIIANQGKLNDETLRRQKDELKKKLRDLEN